MARTDPQINVRIPQQLRDFLDAAIATSGNSLTAEIVERLEQSSQLQEDLLRSRQEVLSLQKSLAIAAAAVDTATTQMQATAQTREEGNAVLEELIGLYVSEKVRVARSLEELIESYKARGALTAEELKKAAHVASLGKEIPSNALLKHLKTADKMIRGA